MKKKIFGGIAVLAIAAVAAIGVNFNSQKKEISTLGLANVEALAQSEATVYDLPNQYLKLKTCIPFFWQDKLICKPMDGIYCKPSDQKPCSGGPVSVTL